MANSLTSRQHKILWATVRSYIKTAEPVGSKSLAEHYDLGVSPATIRNDLAFLEQGGLLLQPHVSAGRIPSDSGYRVYVDDLLEGSHPLGWQALTTSFEGLESGDDVMQLLARSARILARLSGCMAIVSAPQTRALVIRHLQLVMVDPERIMVVVVADSCQTHSVLVNLTDNGEEGGEAQVPLSTDAADQLLQELQLLSNFLTLNLRGKTFADLQDLSWLELDQAFRAYATWLHQLLGTVAQRCLKPTLGQLFTSGVSKLIRQPEFAQSQKVEGIVHLVEDNQDALAQILGSCRTAPIRIYIGTENPLEPIRHCTLITSTYYRDQEPLGTVSVIGPTRLPYEQALASIRAILAHLTHTLAIA